MWKHFRRSGSRILLSYFGLCLALIWQGSGFSSLAGSGPAIEKFEMVGGITPRLTLRAERGVTNEVQSANALLSTNWIALTNWVAAETNAVVVDGNAPTSSRFYRFVAKPVPVPGMRYIPAGDFAMGNCMDPSEGDPDELPLHTVYVSAFYMDQYEVSKALWDEVIQWATNHAYQFDFGAQGKAPTHPVQMVTWYDALKWLNARSEKEGRVPAYYMDAAQTVVYRTGQTNLQNDRVKWNAGYRLPTETEWEKAARGGTPGHRYPWADADTITHSRANYYSSGGGYDISPTRAWHPAYRDAVYPSTSPVGSFAPNGYGLYDMMGNVWEWAWDWNNDTYYSLSPATNPHGPVSGSYRISRGGCWDYNANYGRVAYRYYNHPTNRNGILGFRSVLPLGQP